MGMGRRFMIHKAYEIAAKKDRNAETPHAAWLSAAWAILIGPDKLLTDAEPVINLRMIERLSDAMLKVFLTATGNASRIPYLTVLVAAMLAMPKRQCC